MEGGDPVGKVGGFLDKDKETDDPNLLIQTIYSGLPPIDDNPPSQAVHKALLSESFIPGT